MEHKKCFKILVVDDEKSNIDVLSHILREDYMVFAAKSGSGAIRTAKEQSPDIILLDVIMPDFSGFEVLAELKSTESTSEIPVIFITGLDNMKDEEKGFELGAVDYITKPFRYPIVKARVRTHLKIVEQMRIIERLCMTDELTDLANRRYFNDQLHREWGRSIREKTPISMLMIDVDSFKSYNDTYGHLQGDALLRALSGVFRNAVRRTTDFVARWGGEEFIVLLPGAGMCDARKIAENIRLMVEEMTIPCRDDTPTRITVSIGVSTEEPDVGESFSGFMSKSDKALYEAKRQGRNKVCVYCPDEDYIPGSTIISRLP